MTMKTYCANVSNVYDTSIGVGFYLYYYGIFFIILVVNLCGNSLILISSRRKKLRTPENCVILSLAVSDLCHGVVYTFYNISHMEIPGPRRLLGTWPSCIIIIFSVLALQMISSYTLVAITTTRYVALTRPLAARVIITHKVCLSAIALIWLIGWILATGVYSRPDFEFCGICRFELVYSWKHSLAYGILTFVVPFTIMLVLYIQMANVARIHRRETRKAYIDVAKLGKTTTRKKFLKKELKMVGTIGLLFLFFSLAVIPFVIYSTILHLLPRLRISPFVRATCRLLIHLNTAANVFIYAGGISTFRKAFKQDLDKLTYCLCRRQRVSPNTNSSTEDKNSGGRKDRNNSENSQSSNI